LTLLLPLRAYFIGSLRDWLSLVAVVFCFAVSVLAGFVLLQNRAFIVLRPTIPSTLKPFDLWKFRTAVRVLLPNMPSALPQLKPSSFSLFCRALTWLPLLPTLRVEVIGTLLDGFESLGVLGFLRL